jgi:hypothetical protein
MLGMRNSACPCVLRHRPEVRTAKLCEAKAMLCSFTESTVLAPIVVGLEAQWLGRLEPGRVAPGFVWLTHGEEQFYLSNNLPEQLRTIFKAFNPRRLDEDALEVACERAQKLVRESYLLEDFVALFYTALKNVGIEGHLHVRREFSGQFETGQDRRGALLALKRVWAQDWSFEAVLGRLDASGNIGVDARPSLIFAGPGGTVDAERSSQVSKTLARKIQARVWDGLIVGLVHDHSGDHRLI